MQTLNRHVARRKDFWSNSFHHPNNLLQERFLFPLLAFNNRPAKFQDLWRKNTSCTQCKHFCSKLKTPSWRKHTFNFHFFSTSPDNVLVLSKISPNDSWPLFTPYLITQSFHTTCSLLIFLSPIPPCHQINTLNESSLLSDNPATITTHVKTCAEHDANIFVKNWKCFLGETLLFHSVGAPTWNENFNFFQKRFDLMHAPPRHISRPKRFWLNSLHHPKTSLQERLLFPLLTLNTRSSKFHRLQRKNMCCTRYNHF